MDFKQAIKQKAVALQTEFDTLPYDFSADRIISQELMIKARDGIGLKTYIFYPDTITIPPDAGAAPHEGQAPAALPVLVQRSCYPHAFLSYEVGG